MLAWLVAACGAPAVTGAPAATVGPDGIGAAAPAIVGQALDGSAFDLSAERGHPVVVNFWASWCTPCRDEFPVLEQARATHAADGLVVVGVLYRDQPAPARAFVSDFGADWPTVTDADGAIAKAYRVAAPPQTYFIDAGGVLRGLQIGEMTADDFALGYARIAPGGPSPSPSASP